MNFELISEEDFANLSEEDDQCFVEFESICRRNMTRMLDNENSEHFFRSVRQQYMSSVYSVANECRIPNIPEPDFHNEDKFYEDFSNFSLAVQGEVARIRVRGRRSRNSLSVQLTGNTRTKVEYHISRLREIIDTSDLSLNQKKILNERLNDFLSEMENRRLNLGKAMLVLSLVLSGLSSATTIAADGTTAVNNIIKLIGIDKASEEEAISRLASPPKALPAPEQEPAGTKKPPTERYVKNPDWDDDIPF